MVDFGIRSARSTFAVLAAALFCGPVQAGLVAHWKLDDGSGSATAEDSVGTNEGTLTNMDPATDWVGGKVGGALDFDGADDYVEIPYDITLGLNEFTVCAWVNINSEPGSYGILGTRFGGDNTFDVKVAGASIHGDVGDGSSWLSTSVDIGSPDGDLAVGTWYHVAYVCTTDEATLYLDGDPKATVSYSGTPLLMKSGQTMRVGSSYPGEDMHGLIDDIRIYDVALTAAEVDDVFKRTPEVTITSADPDAIEELDPATFTVTREGNLSGNLTVLVHIGRSGPANYAMTPGVSEPDGTVTILDGDASATVTVTPTADTTYESTTTLTISISPSSDYDIGAADEVVITITDDDLPPPGAFSLRSPADEAVNVTDTPQLTWTAASGAISYTVSVYDDPSLTPPAEDSGGVGAPATTYVVPGGILAWDAQYWWHVVAHNASVEDTDADPTGWYFWTSVGGAPTVTGSDPDHEEEDVDISAGIEIHFSEPMAAGTAGVVSVADAAGGDVAGAATLSGLDMVLTFVPDEDLDYEATYTVTIDAATATDKATPGNSLDATNSPLPAGGDYVFTFTTFEDLTGLASGEGCAPGVGRAAAWLVTALATLAARRRRP